MDVRLHLARRHEGLEGSIEGLLECQAADNRPEKNSEEDCSSLVVFCSSFSFIVICGEVLHVPHPTSVFTPVEVRCGDTRDTREDKDDVLILGSPCLYTSRAIGLTRSCERWVRTSTMF
jgi:hypothetical protein